MKNTTLQTENKQDNRPHRSKLVWTMAILILIPTITAIGFMALLMIREIKDKSNASYVSDIVKYMSVSSQLIHELQKERGLSYGFIGVSRNKMVSNLDAQRLMTDQKLATLNTHLESIEVELYGQRFAVQLNLFQENIIELLALRNKIDSKSITRNEPIDYFSEVINNIIGTFQEANITIRDSELAFPYTACINFIMAKEMAGIERAMIVGFAAADKPVSHEDQHKWMRVLKGQDALFKAFMHQVVGAGILDKFNNVINGVNTKAVEDIRKQIFKKHDEGRYGLMPLNVFHVATRRIDELKGVEDALVQEILQSAERISSKKNVSLIIYSALAGASIIGMYVLCFIIARSVTRPIITLTSEVRRVAEGDLEHEFEIKSKNEIGDLFRSFKRMRRILKQNRSMREKTEKEIKSLNKFLEQRVVERTAALEKANAKLQTEITGHMRSEEALLASEERLSSLSRATFEGIAFHKDGVIIDCNEQFAGIVGYGHDELMGIDGLTLTHPEDRELARSKIATSDEVPYEIRLLRKDGSIKFVKVHAQMATVNGEILRVVVVRDITEQKIMEEELLKMQKLESVGILAGGIAHDFNNRLQAILGNISVAKLHIDPEDEVYDKLTNAEMIAMQSKSLSQQLLTLSRGGQPIKRAISASALIKESASFALSGSNVRCELDLPDCSCFVEADKGQMNQVFNNLFINADQAMPKGGIIKVSAEHCNVEKKDLLPLKEGRYVKIAIKDQGTGIPEENLQKIFDPYFTTKEKGSGLGLAITYSIIKKHDGYITVESEMGVGTTFYVYLPTSGEKKSRERILSKVEVSRLVTAKGKGAEKTTLSCKNKILFMDDEDLIRLAISQHLRNLKYEVETARDGFEAIELYKSASESGKPFNAIVLDLTIPGGMGGKETIERLLEIDPEVRAIVASGYANDPVMTNYKENGFKGVVEKPYEIDGLNELLQKVIMEKQT